MKSVVLFKAKQGLNRHEYNSRQHRFHDLISIVFTLFFLSFGFSRFACNE